MLPFLASNYQDFFAGRGTKDNELSSVIKCANLKVNNERGEIMTRLLVIDVGGTSIKFGKWDQGRLALLPAVKTPADRDGFFKVVSHACEQIRQSGRLDGVAISIPGG